MRDRGVACLIRLADRQNCHDSFQSHTQSDGAFDDDGQRRNQDTSHYSTWVEMVTYTFRESVEGVAKSDVMGSL